MNIALITAGGNGTRMKSEVPKQFITVYDKPIIVYTIERFQKHPAIDKILIACKGGWENILESYIKQYNLNKVDQIVEGGENGQASIFHMLEYAHANYNEDDIVLVHDGTRCMVSQDIISNNISVCKDKGNAITAVPMREALLLTETREDSVAGIDRDKVMQTQTPHAFRLGELYSMHMESQRRGMMNTVASCTMAIELGKKVYFSEGSPKNFKITEPDDIDIFKSLLNEEKKHEQSE